MINFLGFLIQNHMHNVANHLHNCSFQNFSFIASIKALIIWLFSPQMPSLTLDEKTHCFCVLQKNLPLGHADVPTQARYIIRFFIKHNSLTAHSCECEYECMRACTVYSANCNVSIIWLIDWLGGWVVVCVHVHAYVHKCGVCL